MQGNKKQNKSTKKKKVCRKLCWTGDRQTDRDIVVAMQQSYKVVQGSIILPGVVFSDLISSPSQP